METETNELIQELADWMDGYMRSRRDKEWILDHLCR